MFAWVLTLVFAVLVCRVGLYFVSLALCILRGIRLLVFCGLCDWSNVFELLLLFMEWFMVLCSWGEFLSVSGVYICTCLLIFALLVGLCIGRCLRYAGIACLPIFYLVNYVCSFYGW